MTELAKDIGQLIRKNREIKKISQEHLALLSGIDRSYLGRIERGEVNLTILKLYIIARSLNMSPKDLLP